MPSRADSTPTPLELATWVAVASPLTARGRYLWSPSTTDGVLGFALVGRRPVVTGAPPDVEVSFWHAAPERWRIDGPDGPLGVTDGNAAAAWSERGVEVGEQLRLLVGPADLLHPDPRQHRGQAGSVEPAELLGRRCWLWQQGGTRRWVDDESGCLLRLEDAEAVAELTALETGVELDPALFQLPDGIEPPTVPVRQRPDTRPPQPQPLPFLVPWWPSGTGAHPEAGDAEVPELLLSLHTARESDPQVWLGIAPAGRPPRVHPGAPGRRWDGDGWSFALSWEGALTDADVERVIASVPRTWDGVAP